LSDPLEEAYYRYIHPDPAEEPNETIACPRCESYDVDRKAGYRGEYRCRNCGIYWTKR